MVGVHEGGENGRDIYMKTNGQHLSHSIHVDSATGRVEDERLQKGVMYRGHSGDKVA